MKLPALFFSIALRRDSIQAAVPVALVVGTILNLINQRDRLFVGDFASVRWFKFALTYAVPFCVATYARTMAKLRFDPGVRAAYTTQLKCTTCGKSDAISKGEIIPECRACGPKTAWQPVAPLQ